MANTLHGSVAACENPMMNFDEPIKPSQLEVIDWDSNSNEQFGAMEMPVKPRYSYGSCRRHL